MISYYASSSKLAQLRGKMPTYNIQISKKYWTTKSLPTHEILGCVDFDRELQGGDQELAIVAGDKGFCVGISLFSFSFFGK